MNRATLPPLQCGCCDRRAWRKHTPLWPDQWICPTCEDWLQAFNHPAGPAVGPLYGPVKSVRVFLARQPITVDEVLRDNSPWILINQPRPVFEAWQALLRDQPGLVLKAVR